MSESGFTQYVIGIRPTMRREAYLLCGDWYEADDLVQQTLLKVLLRWSALDRSDQLTAYTRKVLVRTFISNRRSPRWSREFLADELPEPAPEPGEQERLADRLMLLDALALLKPRQRATIILRYWEHLSPEEAADALGCSVSTIRSQTFRALARLRSFLYAGTHSTKAESGVDQGIDA